MIKQVIGAVAVAGLMAWGAVTVASAEPSCEVSVYPTATAHGYKVIGDKGGPHLYPAHYSLERLKEKHSHCSIDANAFSGDNESRRQTDDWGVYGAPEGRGDGTPGNPDCSGEYYRDTDAYDHSNAVKCAPMWYLSDIGVSNWWSQQ